MSADKIMSEDYLLVDDEADDAGPDQQMMGLAPEPLFGSLLRGVVGKLWPGDAVMADLVEHVAGPISACLAHVGAKGGEFVARRQGEGKVADERYSRDQSQRAHLFNGLFPVLHVARTLQRWGAPQFRCYDDTLRRVFIAGYVLHDYLKLPGVEATLDAAGFGADRPVGHEQMPTLEAAFLEWGSQLGLDSFLSPVGGLKATLHDVIYVACNTQTRWGTLRNLALLPHLALERVQLDLAEQLSRLADLLAYVARTPEQAAAHPSIQRELATLSNQTARLTCHHLADNRGVLSNFIQNAALAAMQGEYRVPLLYAPSGVVYLEHKAAAPPVPQVSNVAEAAIQRLQATVGQALRLSRNGIKRDGKGIKYAPYYWLFFDLPAFVRIGVQATFDVVREGKSPVAGKRYAKMAAGGWLGPGADLNLPDDVRVDQLAEWCYLAENQVRERLPEFDTGSFLLGALELEDLRAQFDAVPRDNRAGGVGYHWYLAAGEYLRRHPGLDPQAWFERVATAAERLAEALAEAENAAGLPRGGPDDWDDLRAYIRRNLTLGSAWAQGCDRNAFASELRRYESSKRYGATRTRVCTLCSSSYRVDKQRETAILFAPQVYSNKRPLHTTDALREMCSICSLEIMLRQVLMNRSGVSGGRFEGRRVRYLYLYPTYFFTPETLEIVRRAYGGLQRISFTELRRQLVSEDGAVDLSPTVWQRLEPLLLIPQDERNPVTDRYLRLQFPENEPVTFYFIGIPPAPEAKDAEAWVHPAFLALVLPLCLDVKVVASESSLPVVLEADDIPETVYFDGPHPAITRLLGGMARINVDQVLGSLQQLAVGYLINMDGNSRMGRTGYDYRWQDLPGVARALEETKLYAFHYLKRWQRQQKRDSIPAAKARQYLAYMAYLNGGGDMSYARQLTLLYRQFYRARRYNSNSVLRPISIAARAILTADPRLFDQEGLVEAVYGELAAFSERARREGLAYLPKGSTRQERDAAMRRFAALFVDDLFCKTFRGDRSALRGKQLNLLKSACETVYQDEAARDRAEREALEQGADAAADAATVEEEKL